MSGRPFTHPDQIERSPTALMDSSAYGEASQRFAARYAAFSAEQQVGAMLSRVEELLN